MKNIKKITNNTPYNNKCYDCNVCCKDGVTIYLSPIDLYRISEYTKMNYKEIIYNYCDIAIHKATGLPLVVLKKKQGGSCIFKSGILCLLRTFKPEPCLIYPLKKTKSYKGSTQYIKKNINCNIAKKNLDTITTLEHVIQKSSDIDIEKYSKIWSEQMYSLAYNVIGDFRIFKERLHHTRVAELNFKLVDALYDINNENSIDEQMQLNFNIAKHILINEKQKYLR